MFCSGRCKRRRAPSHHPRALRTCAHRLNRQDAAHAVRRWAALLPLLFSVFSALVCTQVLLFNKSVLVLWRLTLNGDNQASAGQRHMVQG